METTNTNSGVTQKKHLLKEHRQIAKKTTAKIIAQKQNGGDTLPLTIPALGTIVARENLMLLLLKPFPSHKIGSSWFLLLYDPSPSSKSEHLIGRAYECSHLTYKGSENTRIYHCEFL